MHNGQPHKLNALGCQCYIGGFTLGVKQHFNVLAHLELNDYGVATFKANNRIPVFLPESRWPLSRLKSMPIDLLYGNPPCAAWSNVGPTCRNGQDAWKTDPRPSCTLKLFSLIEQLDPTTWIWESVIGAWSKGREFMDSLINTCVKTLKRSVTIILHNAARHGAAQRRMRMFMVAHKVPLILVEPLDTTLNCIDVLNSVKDNPGEIPYKSTNRLHMDLIKRCPPGKSLRNFYEDEYPYGSDLQYADPNTGLIRGKPGINPCRLPINGPMGAMLGTQYIHPTEHRGLGMREILAMCGFDPDYKLCGSLASKPSQICRGVLPSVGEWIAHSCAQSLNTIPSSAKDLYAMHKCTMYPYVHLIDWRKTNLQAVDLTKEYK